MKKQNIRKMLARLNREDGQGMTEYIIIVALIAVAAIGVVTVFGRQIAVVFDTSTAALQGTDGQGQNAARKANPNSAKSLNNFNTDNAAR